METAVFKVGDIVRHKTTGERGIVVSVGSNSRCTRHPPFSSVHLVGGSEECEWVEEFDGTYDISIGLGKTAKGVPEVPLVLDEET